MTKRFLVLLFTISMSVSVSVSVFSQEEIEDSLLNLEKESWNLGISRFSGINLEKQNEYLISALPLLAAGGSV